MSFEDLERWAVNAKLWKLTCQADDTTKSDVVLGALRTAHSLFEALGDPYADKLKSMPDPAVSGLFLGLSHSDHTTADPYDKDTARHSFVPLSPYAVTDAASGLPPYTDLSAVLQDNAISEKQKQVGLTDFLKAYRGFVDLILQRATLGFTTRAGALSVTGPDQTHATGTVEVPTGTVAQLRVSPALRDSLFNPASGAADTGIFHPRMSELAVGEWCDATLKYRLFDGPVLAVEVMSAPTMQVVPRETVTIGASGHHRGYVVTATPAANLRLFSQVDLITQRWRFNGRPIYNWIDPSDGTLDGPVAAIGPTLHTKETPAALASKTDFDSIAAFEGDTFGQRDSTDGDYKRVRLRPANEITELGRFDWPERSATYFRHRIELISRYSGAMQNPADARVRNVFKRDTQDDPWTARVAILAQPDAAPLGRPQFRTYLPVQKRVGDRKSRGPTPVTCVLSEPPFAQLGLADRIDAGIVVKNLYEVATIDGKTQLSVQSIRKEVSPDPLLSYFKVADATSRLTTVSAEGPVGLHFDHPEAKAPAWSNTQYMLHIEVPRTDDPASATPEELEESFAGISLSRRADPGWSWYAPTDGPVTEILRDTWIPLAGQTIALKGTKTPVSDYVTISSLSSLGGTPTVQILKNALYKGSGTEFVTVWDGPVDAVLIKVMGDNSYRLGIYQTPSGLASQEGQINRAQLVTSIIFTVESGDRLTLDGSVAARPTTQSEATFMEWARSARDLSVVMQTEPDAQTPTPAAIPVPTRRLQAQITDNRIHFPSRIGTPLAQRRYPLHVQRRLAMILRKPSKQVGHQIDLFHDALLADDWGEARTAHPAPNLSLVLAEMECRAEIVLINTTKPNSFPEALFTDGPSGLQAQYRKAIFDLPSTTGGSAVIRQMRFHIRATNTPLDLTKLAIAPHLPDMAIDLEKVTDVAQMAHALDVVLYAKPDEDGIPHAALYLSWRDTAGNPCQTDEQNLKTKDGATVLFDTLVKDQETLTLQINDSSTELRWVDVSMLHSSRPFCQSHSDAFDFDWLFGAEDASDRPMDLPRAVSADVLNRLPEAQARIIGLSDPIDVK